MIYTEKYRVRWHDTDAWREMFPSEVLAYMQETAHHQFRTHAVTLDELRDTQGVGFILSRVAVDFLAPVHAHDAIAVETNTCPPHGYTFPRAFRMKRGHLFWFFPFFQISPCIISRTVLGFRDFQMISLLLFRCIQAALLIPRRRSADAAFRFFRIPPVFRNRRNRCLDSGYDILD